MNNVIGSVQIWSSNLIIPMNWLECQGQLLPINSFNELYSIIGNVYGGDGETTFALPNFSSRVACGSSKNMPSGHYDGQEKVQLTLAQLPTHSHYFAASSQPATDNEPGNNSIAAPGFNAGRSVTPTNGFVASAPDTILNSQVIGSAGESLPHNNMQPFLALYYIICVKGLYPQRN